MSQAPYSITISLIPCSSMTLVTHCASIYDTLSRSYSMNHTLYNMHLYSLPALDFVWEQPMPINLPRRRRTTPPPSTQRFFRMLARCTKISKEIRIPPNRLITTEIIYRHLITTCTILIFSTRYVEL